MVATSKQGSASRRSNRAAEQDHTETLLEATQVREIQGGVKLTYGVRFSEQDVLRDTMASLSWKLADATTLQLHGAR